MITWTTTSEQTIRAAIPTIDPTGKQLRVKAYEREVASASSMRNTKITVAENQILVLPTIEAAAGLTSIHIVQKANSKLTLAYFQNLAQTESGFTIITIDLEEGAELECYTATFGASQSSLIIETNMNGAETRLKQRNVFFGSEAQSFEVFSTTNMRGVNGQAIITAQGALSGNSHGRFDGGIVMSQTAHGCDGQLTEKALLLSSECKIDAIPRLKIDTNDVTAGHSAAISRIDDEQLFYAASRGIEKQDAMRMITEGFMTAASADTPFEEISQKICVSKLDSL